MRKSLLAMAGILALGSAEPARAVDDIPELPVFVETMFDLRTVAAICFGFVRADTKIITGAIDDYWAIMGDHPVADSMDQILGMRQELRKLSGEEARQTCIEHLEPAMRDYRDARDRLLKVVHTQTRMPPEFSDRQW